MEKLNNLQVVVLATDGFEEQELTDPVQALREAKIRAVIIAPHSSTQEFIIITFQSSSSLNTGISVHRYTYSNADALRVDVRVQKFIQAMQSADKPIAAICHAPWELISAGVVRGRTLTSYHTIQDDIRNAGGNWVDKEVVVDRHWVTSRQPSDIPAFNREFLRLLSQASHTAAKAAQP